jgi:hypothetical protein
MVATCGNGTDVYRLAQPNFWQICNPEQNGLPVSGYEALKSNPAPTKNAKRTHRRLD